MSDATVRKAVLAFVSNLVTALSVGFLWHLGWHAFVVGYVVFITHIRLSVIDWQTEKEETK